MKKSRLTVHVLRELGVACAGAVVGAVLVGVLTPAPEAAAPRAATAAASAPAPRAARQVALPAAGCAHGTHAPAASVAAAAEGEADAGGRAMALIDVALAAHRRAIAEDGDACEANQEADAAHAALMAALQEDPRTVERVAGRLQTTRDPLEAEVLAALLGQFADPAVEQAALTLATGSGDPALRVVGFDLLDALDLPSARPVALTALDREVDTTVRRAAIHALPPPDGASITEAVEVVSRLARVVGQDPDPETRRRAARVLGDWSHTPEALETLVAALRRDAAPEVRAGAAFGLELARSADPRARAALVSALEDQDDLVRENAWRALGAAAPLSPAEHAAWVAFRDAREAVGN